MTAFASVACSPPKPFSITLLLTWCRRKGEIDGSGVGWMAVLAGFVAFLETRSYLQEDDGGLAMSILVSEQFI